MHAHSVLLFSCSRRSSFFSLFVYWFDDLNAPHPLRPSSLYRHLPRASSHMARAKRFYWPSGHPVNPITRDAWIRSSDPAPSGPERRATASLAPIKIIQKKQQMAIKSLVSPREVVFRFPFQLEVDWAFQGRSAVKSELYMSGPEDT